MSLFTHVKWNSKLAKLTMKYTELMSALSQLGYDILHYRQTEKGFKLQYIILNNQIIDLFNKTQLFKLNCTDFIAYSNSILDKCSSGKSKQINFEMLNVNKQSVEAEKKIEDVSKLYNSVLVQYNIINEDLLDVPLE